MKKNNKLSAPHALETINDIINNSKKDIFDIKKIGCKTKIKPRGDQNNLLDLEKKSSRKEKNSLSHLTNIELQRAIIHLQCLAKELEIEADSLNNCSYHIQPLGNFILNSLSGIENKLFTTCTYLNELSHDKKKVEEWLIHALYENKYLNKEAHEIQRKDAKKIKQLEEQLDAKKREILAIKQLVKSLKRKKRRPTLKSWFYHYKSSWEALHT